MIHVRFGPKADISLVRSFQNPINWGPQDSDFCVTN